MNGQLLEIQDDLPRTQDFRDDPPSTVYGGRHAEVTAGKIRSSSLESKIQAVEHIVKAGSAVNLKAYCS